MSLSHHMQIFFFNATKNVFLIKLHNFHDLKGVR